MPREIMLDCETLSLEPNALVWQCAAGEIGNAYIPSAIGWLVDPEIYRIPLEGATFAVSAATERWTIENGNAYPFGIWEKRRENPNASGAFATVQHIHQTLMQMRGPDEKDCIFWAKNAAFDFPILENLFRFAGLRAPWYHRNKGCLYTMRIEVERQAQRRGLPMPEAAVNQGAHNAAYDVLYQIEQLDTYREFLDGANNAV
jgi:hypothetical protein